MTKSRNADSPQHPGDVLRVRIEELGLTPFAVGVAIKITPSVMYQMVVDASYGGHPRRGISAQMALRFARFFGDTPEYWLGLQNAYELGRAQSDTKFMKKLATIAPHTGILPAVLPATKQPPRKSTKTKPPRKP